MTNYLEVPAGKVPGSIVFTVPRRHQGQAVEVAYSRGIPAGTGANMDADDGDPWKRVTDGSDGSVRYYHRQGLL